MIRVCLSKSMDISIGYNMAPMACVWRELYRKFSIARCMKKSKQSIYRYRFSLTKEEKKEKPSNIDHPKTH